MKQSKVWKVIKKALLYTLATVGVFIVGMLAFVMLGLEKALNLPIEGVSLDHVDDGIYEGQYNGFRWSNTVAVTVRNHEITAIEQVKPQAFAKAETIAAMTDRVLTEQNTQVDAVSGATADSKAFLKAVENAIDAQK